MNANTKIMNPVDYAILKGVSLATVHRWIRFNRLPPDVLRYRDERGPGIRKSCYRLLVDMDAAAAAKSSGRWTTNPNAKKEASA